MPTAKGSMPGKPLVSLSWYVSHLDRQRTMKDRRCGSYGIAKPQMCIVPEYVLLAHQTFMIYLLTDLFLFGVHVCVCVTAPFFSSRSVPLPGFFVASLDLQNL